MAAGTVLCSGSTEASGWNSRLKSFQAFAARAASLMASYGVMPALLAGQKPMLRRTGTRSGFSRLIAATMRSTRALYSASASGLANATSGLRHLSMRQARFSSAVMSAQALSAISGHPHRFFGKRHGGHGVVAVGVGPGVLRTVSSIWPPPMMTFRSLRRPAASTCFDGGLHGVKGHARGSRRGRAPGDGGPSRLSRSSLRAGRCLGRGPRSRSPPA